MVDRGEFKREIRALLAILIIFCSTYLLRGIWDLKTNPASEAFTMMMESFSIAILCDFIPVMFLLVFHYKNFNAKIIEKAQDRASSEESFEVVRL